MIKQMETTATTITRPRRYSRWLQVTAFILACVSFSLAFTVFFVEENTGWMIDRDTTGYYSFEDAFANSHITNSVQFHRSLDNIAANISMIQYLESLREQQRGYSGELEMHQGYYGYYYENSDVPEIDKYNLYVYDRYYGLAALDCHIAADIKYLNSNADLVYYIESDVTGAVYTNVPGATLEWIGEFTYTLEKHYPFGNLRNANAAFYAKSIDDKQLRLDAYRQNMRRVVVVMCVSALVCIASVIYSFYATGRDSEEKKIRFYFYDKLFTEFTLAVMFVVLAFGINMLSYAPFVYPVVLPIMIVGLTIEFGLLLSLVRRIKDGSLHTHSLIYALGAGSGRTLKQIYNAQPFVRKILIAVIGFGVALYFAGMFMIVVLMSNRWWVMRYRWFLGLIAIAGLALLPLAVWLAVRSMTRLTGIQEGLLSEEMSRRLRAERLRTELISNVSHDIRTPLTSVITYVDLLKSENIENEKARDYIEVIAAKSQRLKALTDDLFEASKAASGNIPVTLETLDLNELITQGLGEMDTKIRESGLDFRFAESDEKAVVSADGKLLWRVVENLLSNVFKYALPASRVYIEITTDDTYAMLAVKNISAEELNIPAEELLERFRRGDEARGGEGSGLGLSIAQSLTEAMGGKFGIAVDGDLFKATVTLVKY